MSRPAPTSAPRSPAPALLRRGLAVLCLAAFSLPAAMPLAGAGPRDRLERLDDRIDAATEDLHDVDRRSEREQRDLAKVNERRAELARELARLQDELDQAQGELDEANLRLDQTTAELTATQDRLQRTRNRLASQHDAFVARARASYMYGGSAQMPMAVLEVDEINDFGRAMKYARVLLQQDRRGVERMAALETVIQRDTVELGKLQDRQAAERRLAEADRDRVSGIVERRQAVAAEAAAEAQRHEEMLARLDEQRRAYLAMVADLEAESDRIERELRERAEAQARARARAAAASRSASAAAPAPVPQSSGVMLWPARGPKTSDFGWRTHPIFGTRRMHTGVDIGAGYGAPISAAKAGTVVSAGSMGGYGNAVVIDHGGGLSTLYAHQSTIAVSAGQSVGRGQTIGYVGSTGYSTGPHLHFEVRVNGEPRDPMAWF